MEICFLFLLGLLATTSLAQHNPWKDPHICGRPVCKDNQKFKYGPTTAQTYKYSVQVKSLFNGTSANESSLLIESTAIFEFMSECDGLLSLTDVTLTEGKRLHPDSSDFADTLSQFSIRFSFADGIISEVCPPLEEETWVLNFKKGLLSLIQNSMKRLDLDYTGTEEDVKGICPTTYKVLGAKETSLIIEKTKDLNLCEDRSKVHSMVQSTPYYFRTKSNQEATLLRSSSRCELSVENNIYNEIRCEESYIIEPFSNNAAGATTAVVQKLTLVKEENSTLGEQPEITRRTSLLFDHVPSPKRTQDEVNHASDLIKSMCRLSSDDVQIEFSDLFTKFIQTLRLLSHSALMELYEHAGTTCPTGKRHVLDALPYIGTTAAVKLMKTLILGKAIPTNTVNEWMLSISFLVRPDEEMMRTVEELLERAEFQSSVVLSVSALTHTYCKQNSNCRDNDAVLRILQYLESRISEFYNGDKNDRITRDNLMVALKALGNTGTSSDDFELKLIDVIEDESVDISVRVAAIETYRRFPCDRSRGYFEDLYRNQDQQAELRIAAYLQVMRCPNYLLIRTIRHTLENEEVNQVGSFVWSHLSNLLKSSIPSRVEIQGLLSDKDLVKKFSSDVRKFSHNREGSVFFEEYNVGANYETNIIFSTASYVPRSAMLNLTVDLFGESVNLLEVYGRAEGFENYLESIFGPKGPLSARNLQDKIPKMRWARSPGENDVLQSQIDELPNVMENKFGEPKVSMGMKVFGNDLKYATYDGEKEIREALQTLRPLDHLKRILSGKELNYNKATMFLDSSYVVPTGAGLPLSVSALGTAAINLRLFGSLNAPEFAKTKEFELKADISSSVSLDISGAMTVDAYFAKSGIKLKTSMYTSSAMDGLVRVKGWKLLSVKFSIPRKTSEIFGAKSELLVMKRNVEERQVGLKKHRISKSICSWPAVDKTVGLKLCTDYHFMNVTKINNAPYFLLAGPLGFRLFLQKSDPTAKIYLFEYKWIDGEDSSTISLTFDTPDSSLRRLFGANLTLNKQTQNLTLLLQSSAGVLLAKGKYKNTDAEKYIQLALDINNVKHFDASISLKRQDIPHGYVYYPHLHLAVNEEKIVGAQGSVKMVSKRGISQYDVDLKFQTKRVTTKLFGYVSRGSASLATNLKVYYKFIHTKEQAVDVGFLIANKGHQNIMDIRGSASLVSTAYPHFDFDSKLKIQRGNGHTECTFDLISNHKDVEPERMKVGFLFSFKALPNGRKIMHTVASLTRPSKNINLKADLTYRYEAPNTNVYFYVNYGVDKQFSITVYWSRPRSSLEHIEAQVNVTIPSFKPMVLRAKVHEKAPSDYKIDFNGTWFSGHTLSAQGVYQDRSNSRSDSHHAKFIFRSPSFHEINTDIHFYRDNRATKAEIIANQDGHEYAIQVKRVIVSEHEVATEAKLKYKSQMYSFSSLSYSGDHRKISVELHIDQLRDIHFAAWGYNERNYKAAGFELKWDANRDPDQKLAISGNFTKHALLNYEANMLLSYPGRTVLGNFEFLVQRSHFNTLSRISWSDDDSFAVSLSADYLFHDMVSVTGKAEVVTPFVGWRRTTVTGGLHHTDNMYRVNGSVYWLSNQHVSIDLFVDYAVQETALECEFRVGLSSTLKDIPSLSATISHSKNNTRVDSVLRLTYDPHQVIDVKSNWQIDKDEMTKNLTGTVIITTPFNSFNKGYLISKILITKNKYFRGIADMDLNYKKFTLSAEGKLQKITNSMLVVNITTPIEKYKRMTARFGFSEENRHLAALVSYPTGFLGVEMLLSVNSLTEFDVKFLLGTPLEVIQKVIVIAKLKPNEADFQAGWNSLLGGFTGVWHYANITDFEYSYKIYTPIEGFEENGIVAKLIFKEGLDFEVSVKLSVYKLGLKVQGENKPIMLKELGIRAQDIYNGKQAGISSTQSGLPEDDDEELDKDEDPLSWAGLVEIDAIIYPTMKGTLDIDQKGPLYVILAKLTLPHGTAELADQFEYHSLLSMKNKMHLTTPYDSYKIVTSNYDLEIISGHKYLFGFNCNYQNRTQWINTEILVDYISELHDKIRRSHNLGLKLVTPLPTFPLLDLRTSLEMEQYMYSAHLSVTTNSTDVSLTGDVETKHAGVESNLLLRAKTPIVTIPSTQVTYKRVSTIEGQTAVLKLHSPHIWNREVFVETKWLFNSLTHFHSELKMLTPFKGLDKTIAGVRVESNEKETKSLVVFSSFPLDVEINTTLTNTALHAVADLNFNEKKFPVVLSCGLSRSTPETTDVIGTLTLRNKPFKVTGRINYEGNLPIGAKIRLEPEDKTAPIDLEYEVHSVNSAYKLKGAMKHSDKQVKLEADIDGRHALDWNLRLKVETSNRHLQYVEVNAKTTTDGTKTSIEVEAFTPIPKLEAPKFGLSYDKAPYEKHLHGQFEIKESKGSFDARWVWVYMENMRLNLIGRYRCLEYTSATTAKAFYVNPNKTFKYLQLGADANVDAFWSAGSNITISIPALKNSSFEGHVRLPPPNNEHHIAKGLLKYSRPIRDFEYLAQYDAVVSKKHYASSGSLSTAEMSKETGIIGNVGVEYNDKIIQNFVEVRQKEEVYNILYKLRTPKYLDQETFVTKLGYKSSEKYHNITCEAFFPQTRSVGFAHVDFSELANMNGTVNVTIPYKDLSYAGVNFATETSGLTYNRYLKVFWPKNTAILDGKCDIRTGKTLLERTRNGTLLVEFPLTTRHIANVKYKYEENQQNSVGSAVVDYNGDKVLEGFYNCESEARAGFNKDTVHVELQNKLVPIGANYVRKYEYGVGEGDSAAPSEVWKHLHLYHLQNRTKFDVTGQMNVKTSSTGQRIELAAIHSNRTVKLYSGYDILDQQFKQHSRLELSSSVWIEYDLALFNKTTDAEFDRQEIRLNISYPRRNFTTVGSYKIGEASIYTDLSLVWDPDNKTVSGGLEWAKNSPTSERVEIKFKHPSFQKDVSLLGEYDYDDRKLMDLRFKIDYSPDPNQLLVLGGRIDDNSFPHGYNYSYNIWALHNATKLNLNSRGGFYWDPNLYSTSHYTDYQRSYLPPQTAEALARVDILLNEIELKKLTFADYSYLKAAYKGRFPLYQGNISTVYDENNSTGYIFINIADKVIKGELKLTTDGSQSVHVDGLIPDARSALFNIWRDYEDIRITDVSYYLKMNHSRLIMSSLRWRPDLIPDIQSGLRKTAQLSYKSFLDSIHDSRQYIRSEMNDALMGIWQDARPIVEHFLNDLRSLKVIESDVEELKIFLNDSYHANEFYIKDIVTYAMLAFDELALKAQFESVPAIVKEIWAVMGKSGKKIQKSITWVIEKLKTYYENTTEFIHKLLEGDPVEHLSVVLKRLIEQYDEFIKKMHVALVQYMEQLWSRTYTLVVDNWHKALAAIEPTFIKFIHYLETIVWNTSREFLDFLYARKSEIIESPYFAKFTNFTHDLDKFYKDITGNNTISSAVKYTKITWNFLKEKYLNMVPFGKELQAVVTEILLELNELRNLPSVSYIESKMMEVYEKMKWFYDYFDVENRLQRFIMLMHLKLTDVTQTALQAENRYRKAKTKFIFEPSDGIMHLEQKLPMSWHAFNETPKFQEIPELKAIYDIQNYFVTSRTNFWNFYYDYKPYTDPFEWLPPFKAQALIVGSRYFVTFDRKYYNFEGSCSYLLARDFKGRNFTVVLSYDSQAHSHELLLVINKTVVEINVFKDSVKIRGSSASLLPIQIGDTFIHRNADVVTVDSTSGFILECNMKFDVCMFEVSGWYFGKTAGLFGTMNNEPSDDLLTSRKKKATLNEVEEFAGSWSLDRSCQNQIRQKEVAQVYPEIRKLCDELFKSSLSPFTSCFPRVPKEPFWEMCLNSTKEQEACSAAVAYTNLCTYENTPLRIPDVCIKCELPTGRSLYEGEFIRLQGGNITRSADVVFIVEAKECNKNLKSSKNIDTLLEVMHHEFSLANITNNRYSLVLFGGSGVYDRPRSVVNGKIFTHIASFASYFDNIPIGNGNVDIFDALVFASRLSFRPAVSKNFILIPCSECHENDMKHDYGILHQLLFEGDITLHILMNEEFSLQKTRENKIPFGVDSRRAFTKKDIKNLKGDVGLKNLIKLPKSSLGLCLPLALENNGTLFTATSLVGDKRNAVRKFATVFAKRIAYSAEPSKCVDCECTAPSSGVAYMECYPCSYPSRIAIENGFDEDEVLSALQPGDDLEDFFE